MCKHFQYINSQCGHAISAKFSYAVCDQLCEAKLQSLQMGVVNRRHEHPYRQTQSTMKLDSQEVYVNADCLQCHKPYGATYNTYREDDLLAYEHQRTIMTYVEWVMPELEETFPFSREIPREEREDYSWFAVPGDPSSSQRPSSSSSSCISPTTAMPEQQVNSTQNQITTQETSHRQSEVPHTPSGTNIKPEELKSTAAGKSFTTHPRTASIQTRSSRATSRFHRTTHMPGLGSLLPAIDAISSLIPAPLKWRKRSQSPHAQSIPPALPKQQSLTQPPQEITRHHDTTGTTKAKPSDPVKPHHPSGRKSTVHINLIPRPLFSNPKPKPRLNTDTQRTTPKAYASAGTQTETTFPNAPTVTTTRPNTPVNQATSTNTPTAAAASVCPPPPHLNDTTHHTPT